MKKVIFVVSLLLVFVATGSVGADETKPKKLPWVNGGGIVPLVSTGDSIGYVEIASKGSHEDSRITLPYDWKKPKDNTGEKKETPNNRMNDKNRDGGGKPRTGGGTVGK